MLEKRPLIRARILVKAYPQPSKAYGETVCVAAVSEDGKDMLRLYPIRYRRLDRAAQFDRYDLVELRVSTPKDDYRPESRHVDEDSIRVIERSTQLGDASKVKLWQSHIAPSLDALHQDNKLGRRSLGIIKPDPGSLKFFCKPVAEADTDDREISAALTQQSALFEAPLTPLRHPEYLFGYRFKSGGSAHQHIIHDWEVQATWFNYKHRYGPAALDRLKQQYAEIIPTRNLHFILGTMKAHPHTFIVIGLLRSSIDPEESQRQGQLF